MLWRVGAYLRILLAIIIFTFGILASIALAMFLPIIFVGLVIGFFIFIL